MASYDEMKEAARREALGEQASKFYEMTRTPRMFQTAGSIFPTVTRDPLAGLPVDPEAAADLDARYAEVDRHLAAATAARARIPKGAVPTQLSDDYQDKYGYGEATSQETFMPYRQYKPNRASEGPAEYTTVDSYGHLEDLAKRGLISIQPSMRAEMARVRGLARGQMAAKNDEAKALDAAYVVSPLGKQVGAVNPNRYYDDELPTGGQGFRRPPGDGPYSEPKKKK